MTSNLLSIGVGNAKLNKSTLTLSLPAGRTCPGAKDCKAWVNPFGKIQDGEHTIFRCFAASNEASYPNAHKSRAHNLHTITDALHSGTEHSACDLLKASIDNKLTKSIDKFRIHPSGDFFSAAYLQMWLNVIEQYPTIKFYAYTKSLQLFVFNNSLIQLPDNFFVTASHGGWDEHLESLFPRVAYVVNTEDEAAERNLEVDHDDSHCFGSKSFALLVHGIQPANSIAGAAIRARRKAGKHAGYSYKTKQPSLAVI